MTILSVDDGVRVADDFFWAKGAIATVAAPPPEVTSICGKWKNDLTREKTNTLGTNLVHWVWFDEPQYDADGDGSYRAGSILGVRSHFAIGTSLRVSRTSSLTLVTIAFP
ncbi:MAG TPA: hypothetical protein VGN01_06305 [Acidobacteriaceae bacterium]|jgi:hypothetical protein